ncbi:ABC transporter permease [Roseiconus nitratireducens]|uniref:ABC transporter permease n=1 Tax=Roseiconus nitratireducens TaxID=2605748 RepID=A0A5M6CXP0_9BACT|nr:ABC transporter permease [Roseiconus nitratireducens]KAA5539706.1 ABC transporter permease [Roseiconus nitratireducens]
MNVRGNALKFCKVAGLPVLEPFVRLLAGEDPKEQLAGITKFVVLPVFTVLIFLGLWSLAAKTIVTGSARLPGPKATWDAGVELFEMHRQQKAADSAMRQEKLTQAVQSMAKAKVLEQAAAEKTGSAKEEMLASALTYKQDAVRAANFVPSSAPTFVDQIITSLKTVFFGFAIATLIAVPLGVLCGMSPWFNAALTPFIQVFKPVSPLAWLPLAGLVIIWAYSGVNQEDTYFQKAFLISAVTVSLCSLWPTLVNTTLGVASVDKDYMNVAKVLKLSWPQQLFKIILPASLPLMFAGLRISLGVGWMVLIAADMLAQNPGLGKFVWDEFQNGSSQTYARIAFSVIVIGVIGLMLDRIMIFLRNLVSFGNPHAA